MNFKTVVLMFTKNALANHNNLLRKKIYQLICCLVVSASIFSCKTKHDVLYFQNSTNLEQIAATKSFTPVFKIDDILSIVVSASDMEAARPFNLGTSTAITSAEGASSTAGTSASDPSYLIGTDGSIDFPVIGKLKVSGLTRVEVKEVLKEKLKIYIKNPVVTVRLKNFKITVIGEVNGPGSYSIPNERITIIEALGLARDMTIKGNRTNVVVIREIDGVSTYYRVDLTAKTIFESPVYYLAQNDVIYVEPNESQIKNAGSNPNVLAIVLSVLGIALSVANLIIVADR